jgi:5S rRNA maturation endonuclease (ribonuclease M5)
VSRSGGFDCVVAALEAHGSQVRNGKARCPAHDDRSPSLSVSSSPEGHALITCHAGCDNEPVLAALKLRTADLFADAPADGNGSRPIQTRYHYQDPRGRTVVTVVVSRGNGGKRVWREPKGVPANAVPPYRLPELRQAIAEGRPIFVVEGEKCVDAIVRAGRVATTNAGGAGKWLPEHSEAMARAASVIIVADADEPGVAHARAVATSLRAAGVAKVGMTIPRHRPDDSSGYDIADQLAAGHGIDELDDLSVVELEPDPRPVDVVEGEHRWTVELGSSRIDWDDLWASDTLASDWLIEPLVARGRAHALYAPPKTGKSLLILEAAAALTTGRPWLDHPGGAARSVLYLDMEMTRDDLRERLDALGYGPDDDLSLLNYHLLPALPPLDRAEGGTAVAELVESYGAELVVVDTLARVVNGPENDADTYRAFYRHSGSAVKRAGAALVRLDHAGKDIDRGQRGSSAKADDVDVVWRIVPGDGAVLSLRATHRRMAWVPEEVTVERKADPLRHVRVQGSWPAGTAETARRLAELGVGVEESRRLAEKKLRDSGHGARTGVIAAAQRYRRTLPEERRERLILTRSHREPPREPPRDQRSGTTSGTTTPETPPDQRRNHYGNHREPPPPANGNQGAPP